MRADTGKRPVPADRKTTLLIVDDDETGVATARRALAKLGVDNPVEVARDGIVKDSFAGRLCELLGTIADYARHVTLPR